MLKANSPRINQNGVSKLFLLIGSLILITGLGLNYFLGMRGLVQLEVGKTKNLVIAGDKNQEADSTTSTIGFVITLDSVRMQPHVTEYQIDVWRKDSMPANPHAPVDTRSKYLVAQFPLEEMKIQRVDQSDFYFRLKSFYPNFQFAYEYPGGRDTIEPRAPGITLELKTTEGTPIVTLQTDQPNKHILGDVVSLGASIAFYWDISLDSLNVIRAKESKPGNQIVFSAMDSIVYFIQGDTIESLSLEEKMFYNMPGKDSIGFTILHCFPDVAYLKAVPSTKGTQMLNPVAHLEVWKAGASALDAFVYPQTQTRTSGLFEIPGSDYKIGLGMDAEKAIKYCDCHLSIQESGSSDKKSIVFTAGQARTFKGYRFFPKDCSAIPNGVVMEVVHKPGRFFTLAGSILVGLGLLFWLFKRKNTTR